MSALRHHFSGELTQLRLQVEVMAVRVEEALDRMHVVLVDGDAEVAAAALAADDDIDDMLVSLTERCYDLLRRESPVAADLRFVVSVLRMLEELERIGDLALRVVKLAPDHALLASYPPTFELLLMLSDSARGLYRRSVAAWSSQDLRHAKTLAVAGRTTDERYSALMAEILPLEGPTAVPLAVSTLLAGRALERIADHAVIMGERLRYMLTGDPLYLASEVR